MYISVFGVITDLIFVCLLTDPFSQKDFMSLFYENESKEKRGKGEIEMVKEWWEVKEQH